MLKNALKLLLPAVLALLAFFTLTHLWSWDFSVPLGYGGDGLFTTFFIKTLLEDGWIFTNRSTGAPGILQLQDYPLSGESFHLLIIKTMGVAWPDPFKLLNLYYVIRFPLTAAAACWVFLRLGIAYSLAVLFGVLYAFIPFNMMRGQAHMFVGTYYIVPLAILVTLWLMRGALPVEPRSRRFWGSLVVCAILGASGVYHAFFGCALLAVAGTYSLLHSNREDWRGKLAMAVALPGAATLTMILSSIPVFLYHRSAGVNLAVAQRVASESELYGMKIIQLILPIGNHYLRVFRAATAKYNRLAPLVTENTLAAMGLTASVGFVALLAWVLLAAPDAAPGVVNGRLSPFLRLKRASGLDASDERTLGDLSRLNLFAVLLATIGGLGTIIAFSLFPAVRAYNRISIVIAFLGLTAVALVSDRWLRKLRIPARAIVVPVLAVLAGSLAILDQTGLLAPTAPTHDTEFFRDREFVSDITRALPDGAMILQLPFIPFPEHPPVNRMHDYEHLKMYLHSSPRIRWSYPSMTGRPAAHWLSRASLLPAPDLVYRLQDKGFSSIYVDGFGYKDEGRAVVQELTDFLGYAPTRSWNGRRFFFPKLETNVAVRYDARNQNPVSITIRDLSQQYVLPAGVHREAFAKEVVRRSRGRPGPVTVDLKEGDGLADYESFAQDFASPRAHALPESAFKSDIRCAPLTVRVNQSAQEAVVSVRIANRSETPWPRTMPPSEAPYPLHIRSHLFDENMKLIDADFPSHIPLPKAVSPGRDMSLEARVDTSLIPVGTSFLEYDLVQEGMHWAKDLGGRTCLVKLVK